MVVETGEKGYNGNKDSEWEVAQYVDIAGTGS